MGAGGRRVPLDSLSVSMDRAFAFINHRAHSSPQIIVSIKFNKTFAGLSVGGLFWIRFAQGSLQSGGARTGGTCFEGLAHNWCCVSALVGPNKNVYV